MTLVELAIVVVVIGIVAAVALPRINTVAFDADGAARTVAGTVMRAQRLAVQRQWAVNVAFDTANRRLRIVEDTNSNGMFDAGDRTTWQPLAERARFAAPPAALAGAPAGSGAVRGTSLRAVLSLPSVTFLRHGGATSDVVAYLVATGRGHTEARAVTIAQGTGRPDTFRCLDGAWRRGGP